VRSPSISIVLATAVAALATVTGVPALAEPTLALHLTHWVPEVDDPPCTSSAIDDFDCTDIVVEGPREVIQRLYLVATGVETLSRLEFGLDCGVSTLSNFDNCSAATLTSVGGFGFGWPCFGPDHIFTWDPPVGGTGPDDVVVLGYFRVGAVDTPGPIEVRGLLREMDFFPGPLKMVANGQEFVLEEDQRGAADPAAYGDGVNPCASLVPVAERSWSEVKARYR